MHQKKMTLSVEPDFEFVVLAIIADIVDYKLMLHLEKNMRWTFKKNKNIISKISGRDIAFENYVYSDTIKYEEIVFINNKTEGFSLIPSLKQYNYILRLDVQWAMHKHQLLINNLKKLPEVLNTITIQPTQLKDNHHLLFDITTEEQQLKRQIISKLS